MHYYVHLEMVTVKVEKTRILSLKRWDQEEIESADSYCVLANIRLLAEIDATCLCPDERLKCGKFLRQADRNRYLLAHTIKRRFIAKLLNRDPSQLQMSFGKGGKPLLADGTLHFNLSHSGNWVAMAVCLHTAVGVDVEFPSVHGHDLPLEYVLNPADRFLFEPLDATQRFYTSWTLKEAMSKSDGRGLDRPFDSIRLSLENNDTYRGEDGQAIWFAKHTLLADGTHFAFASFMKTDPLLLQLN